MKALAFIALTVTLFVSLFQVNGANLSNNVLAIAVMVLLLVLFSDLKEFNFWGLWGKKKEETIKKIEEGQVVTSKLKPSRYKLAKAEKEDDPQQMSSVVENFLSVSYEIEHLIRVIARSTSMSGPEVAFTPDASLKTLVDSEFVSDDAAEAILSVRSIRTQLIHNAQNVHPTELQIAREVATDIHTQLKQWIENPKK